MNRGQNRTGSGKSQRTRNCEKRNAGEMGEKKRRQEKEEKVSELNRDPVFMLNAHTLHVEK